jgi:hypothetical protein
MIGGMPLRLIDNKDGTYSLAALAGGRTKRVEASLTRPNNTTQYAAGDQVTSSPAAALVFDAVGRFEGGTGIITDAVCVDSANQATKANLRLYLFDGDSAPTPNDDNAQWAPSDADLNRAFAYVELSAWEVGNPGAGGAGNCASFVKNLNVPFQCGAGVDHIWGLLVERGTYTPVAQEQFKVRLGILQD